MSEEKKEVTPAQGMVLWTDGGARPNPGKAGWGLHGYLFAYAKPKKGSGNPDYILTNIGYVTKAEAALHLGEEDPEVAAASDGRSGKRVPPFEQVTPIHYVDGFAALAGSNSNNVGELVGATHALKHALEYDINSLLICCDSEYVVKGFNQYLTNWQRNGWKRRDGESIANPEAWQEAAALRDQLKARGTMVKIQWVRGHNESSGEGSAFGNSLADHLATSAVMRARGGLSMCEVKTSQADGYWKYESDKHPFIANRRMYFNTDREKCRVGEYYLGEHGKEDDLLGKRITDGAHSLVRLKQPDPILELVRDTHSRASAGTDTLVMLRLDQLYRSSTHRELTEHGEYALVRRDFNRLDMVDLGEQPVSRELNPAGLAMRAIEAVNMLGKRLEGYLACDPSLVITDLTPTLYEMETVTPKKGDPKTVFKLKPEYNVGFSSLKVEAKYQNGEGVKAVPVALTLSIDLLDRNALKRLEAAEPTVHLVTWLESPKMFRYATVIKTADDIGIWAGVFSNTRMLTAEELSQ